MPGNFLNIDTEFPSLTGKEKAEDLIPTMMDYMSLLVEQLRYTLNNLDMSNFNAKALSDWEIETSEDLVEWVEEIAALVNQLDSRVAGLMSRMNTAETNITSLVTRMSAAEENITSLGTRMGTAESDITSLETRMTTAEENITSQGQRITDLETWKAGAATNLSGLRTDVNQNAQDISALRGSVQTLSEQLAQLMTAISVNAQGDAVFGNTGQRTDINGDVYINGTPV